MRVLIATDGSEQSSKAVELAAGIKWPAETQILVVSAIEPIDPAAYALWLQGSSDRTFDETAEQDAIAAVATAVERLRTTSAEVSHRTLRGQAGPEIVSAAKEFGSDFIMLGSRGHGPIASALIGSVSAYVADHALCPVLVARGTKLSRIVLAVDGSDCSKVAEDLVSQWPVFADAQIEVTNISDSMPVATALALGTFPAMPEDIQESAILDHQKIAEESARRLASADRSAHVVLARGIPAVELVRVARDSGADLIVVGTHGRTGVQRALLGSVAHSVLLHAKCSVLVVRRVGSNVGHGRAA
jgi:nucleotide-binding universal stress UspA family protein